MCESKEYMIHTKILSSTNNNNKLETSLKIDDKSQSFAGSRKSNNSATEHNANNNVSEKVQQVSVKLQSK